MASVSGEEAVAPVPTASQAAWHGEDPAADVLDVLVQRVPLSELGLQLNELVGVPREGNEEQAAQQCAAHRIDAVGEGVAPARNRRVPSFSS
jgi:hypothetical protein